MAHQNINNPIAFPWSNTKLIAEALDKGELSLSTAIGQISGVLRDSLKIIEDYSSEQVKLSLERKLKVERMDKLIVELTEKCQAMQQALLYKEEKYDEKCREVERYKIICELSANKAAQDDIYLADEEIVDANNNDATQSMSINFENNINFQESNDRVSEMARYYAGGPTKRKRPIDDDAMSVPGTYGRVDFRLRDQMSVIGGVNIKGPKAKLGPVPVNRIVSLASQDEEVKRPKISLVGQRNEVMSSSRNALIQMKHEKITKNDLHRQVASGCWTRLSGRRKKEWPF